MEDSEVLNNPETNVIPDGKPQADVAPEVLQQDTGTLYKSARGATTVTSPVGEKDHASNIANNAMSAAESKQTFNYTSQKEKQYDESVNTKTTMSNGAVLEGVFQAKYGMDDQYKAKAGEDYSWNKQAAEMADLAYNQQANQSRYESIQAKQELDKAANSAFNSYFASEYSARQTQDKMGWSGGQKTASDLQVAFLQAETAANMYTQTEMQKYGVDTKLSIARMYAEAEQNKLALEYYQDAINLAIQEGNETGCYISAEAREMMAQDKIAKDILDNPYSSDAEKARAEQVRANTQAFYDSLGFQHWEVRDPETGEVQTKYYGVQVLQYLTYEETVRNNKIIEELQEQANDIAQQSANTAWKNYELAEKDYNLTLSIQNQGESTKVAEDVESKSAEEKTSTAGDYYINGEGKIKDVKEGSKIYYDNGKYYIWDSSMQGATGTGGYVPLYNATNEDASNYREKS